VELISTRDEFQRGQVFPRQNATQYFFNGTRLWCGTRLPREAIYLISFKTVFFYKIVIKINLLSKIPPSFGVIFERLLDAYRKYIKITIKYIYI
jgi:hypothetical protein